MVPINKLFICTSVFLLVSCFGRDADDDKLVADGSEDLDFPSEVPGQTKALLPNDAVTNWQKFFQATPAPKERDLLAKKLTRWQDSDSAVELLAKGRAEVALGQLKAAETSFRQALRVETNVLDASLELAGIYIKRREIGRAFEFLAAVRTEMGLRDDVSQSFIVRYRYVLALGYLARQDRDKGHDLLSDLIAQDRTFAPAYAALASSYLEQDNVPIAEFVVRRGLDSGNDSAALFNLMGVIAMRQDNHTAALDWIERALALSPGYAPALVNRAHASLRNLQYESAELDLTQALVADPSSTDALVALGLAQRHQGRLSDARATFEKAIDVEPENAEARYNLAVLMVDNFDRPHVAARLFQEVTLSAPRTSQLFMRAEQYLFQLEQHKERL